MKNFIYIFILSLISIAGCRQTNTTAPVLTTQTAGNNLSSARVSGESADAAEPAIVADSEGSLYILYVEHGADKSSDVFLQKFDSQLKSVSEKTRVNSQAGEATAWRGDAPTIAVGTDKTIYVGWTKRVQLGAGNANDLCLSVSRDGGKSFAAPVKINDDVAPSAHGMHSLAVGRDNHIYMAWLDERNLKSEPRTENLGSEKSNDSAPEFEYVKAHLNSNQEAQSEMKHESAEPNREIFFAASTDGGKTFSPNKKLAGEVCPCCKTSLLAASDGHIYASWRQVLEGDFRHIAVASSSDNGKSFSAPKIVSDDRWQIAACPVCGAAMTVDENNRLKIIWFTAGAAGKPGLYEAESNDFGATFSDRVLISETPVFGTPNFISDKNKSFTTVWESNGKMFTAQSQTNRDFTEAQSIGDGSLPSAASVGDKIFVAYIKKETANRTVWLTQFQANSKL